MDRAQPIHRPPVTSFVRRTYKKRQQRIHIIARWASRAFMEEERFLLLKNQGIDGCKVVFRRLAFRTADLI